MKRSRSIPQQQPTDQVASMLNDQQKNMSAIGPIVEEVKRQLRTREEWKVGWTRRGANGAAHAMAREGIANELCKVWLQVPPECILHVVATEIPELHE